MLYFVTKYESILKDFCRYPEDGLILTKTLKKLYCFSNFTVKLIFLLLLQIYCRTFRNIGR